MHDKIKPAPASFASELQGLLSRKTLLENKYSSKKIKDSFSRALPTDIHSALQKWALVTQEKMASPLDHDPHYQHFWSADSRDTVFGALHNSLSSRFSGFSACHPIYNEGALTQALRHAIYSAILNTEATATFMFLPVWGKQMITNPYSKLISAFPHLCYEIGTIPRTKLAYNAPQSCPNQEIPLPQHTWDIQIIAVWNSAARIRLNNHNPAWLRSLASDISRYMPQDKWKLRSVSSHAILNSMHAVMPGFEKCKRLPSDKQQISRFFNNAPTDNHEVVPVPHQSNPNLALKVPDWRTWAYTDGSYHTRNGKQEIGAGVYQPLTDSTNLVEPNGAGITNNICRAELAGIAAAITHSYTNIGTDSLTSSCQIRKQLLYPEKHRQHIQGDILRTILSLIGNSQTKIYIHKVKAHAGIAGNECADAIAKYQADKANNSVADTEIPCAGPDGNPFSQIFWLAKEETREHAASTSTAPASTPKLTYLSNLQAALQLHMHDKHKLGYANAKTGYYSYYQSLLPQVEKKISNAFRTMPGISFPVKRTIFQYRTGTLYNQKHAVRFKRSTDPLCPLPGCHQLDSALHMLSGCQNHIISNMKTERHNIAGRMIAKALSKSPWGAGLINTDVGKDERLAQHNLQLPAHASNRTIPDYLFSRNTSQRSRLTSSRPDAILITPYHAKPNSSSPSSSSSSPSRYMLRSRHQGTQGSSTASRVRQPHLLNATQRHVHLIEIKYCEDTRPEHQLAAAQQQHAHLCKLIDAKAVTIHPILLGVGGTCYTEHTLNQFKKLGLDHQRATKLARQLHAHSAIYGHKLVTTRRAIENNVAAHSQVLGPCASSNPPDPH